MKNMMKKIVCSAAAIATLATSAAFCSTTVSAADPYYNEQYRYHYDDVVYKGWVITKVIKDTDSVRFPEYLDNNRKRRLTYVDCYALDPCDNMKLLIIDSPVANVGINKNYYNNNCCVMWDKRNPNKPTGSASYRYGYFRLGDTDNNDKVDIVDAQKILNAATEILAGKRDGKVPSTLARMDVNRDGRVDVEDAQYALMYYTKIVLCNKNESFEDFMFPYQPKTA